jgi:hypothetical protein
MMGLDFQLPAVSSILSFSAAFDIMDDVSIKGGIGLGLDDFAPDLEIILGFTYGF